MAALQIVSAEAQLFFENINLVEATPQLPATTPLSQSHNYYFLVHMQKATTITNRNRKRYFFYFFENWLLLKPLRLLHGIAVCCTAA